MRAKLASKSSVVRVINFALLLITLISLSGCSTPILIGNCIDSKFERDPVEKNFVLSIENFQTGETETRNITCKGTYAGQCSVRGNNWHWAQTNKLEPYQITLSQNEKINMVFPACASFVGGEIDKKRKVIGLEDGRFLRLKVVWGKTDDWRYPQGYKPYYDPENEYIYYMDDHKKKKREKREPWPTTEEGKHAHYMNYNNENNKRTPYIIPLNFSYKEL